MKCTAQLIPFLKGPKKVVLCPFRLFIVQSIVWDIDLDSSLWPPLPLLLGTKHIIVLLGLAPCMHERDNDPRKRVSGREGGCVGKEGGGSV